VDDPALLIVGMSLPAFIEIFFRFPDLSWYYISFRLPSEAFSLPALFLAPPHTDEQCQIIDSFFSDDSTHFFRAMSLSLHGSSSFVKLIYQLLLPNPSTILTNRLFFSSNTVSHSFFQRAVLTPLLKNQSSPLPSPFPGWYLVFPLSGRYPPPTHRRF